MIKRYGICVGISLVTSIIFCLIFAFAAMKMQNPRRAFVLFGYIAYFAGCLAAGLSAPKLSENPPLIASFICGGIFTVIIMTVSLFVRDETTVPFTRSLIFYIIGCAVSVLIGLISSRNRSNAKKTRRNMMKKMGRR